MSSRRSLVSSPDGVHLCFLADLERLGAIPSDLLTLECPKPFDFDGFDKEVLESFVAPPSSAIPALGCEDVTEGLLEDWIYGRLAPSAADVLEEHLLICPPCCDRAEEEEDTVRNIRDALLMTGRDDSRQCRERRAESRRMANALVPFNVAGPSDLVGSAYLRDLSNAGMGIFMDCCPDPGVHVQVHLRQGISGWYIVQHVSPVISSSDAPVPPLHRPYYRCGLRRAKPQRFPDFMMFVSGLPFAVTGRTI